MKKILLIDNYDSFTNNFLSLFPNGTLDIIKNEKVTCEIANKYNGVIIGPGPGDPRNKEYFGNNLDIILNYKKPILGVCLGFQGIFSAFGGNLITCKKPIHGKTSKLKVYKKENDIFSNIEAFPEVMRYHSIMLDPKTLPDCLEITAIVENKCPHNGIEIQGIKHKTKPIYAVQFHPESFATHCGKELATNFLNIL